MSLTANSRGFSIDRVEGSGKSPSLILAIMSHTGAPNLAGASGPLCLAVTQDLIHQNRWSLICPFGFCSIFSVLWNEAMPFCLSSDILWFLPFAEYLGSLPGSKAVPQTTYATYLQSTIQSNLPVPLWTLYQRSWLDPRRRSDTFPSLTQTASLTSLKESAVRGRKPIQKQCLNLVIPKKESRGWSICIVFARVQPFLWRCLWLNKALFLWFYIKGQSKRSWVPPKPM